MSVCDKMECHSLHEEVEKETKTNIQGQYLQTQLSAKYCEVSQRCSKVFGELCRVFPLHHPLFKAQHPDVQNPIVMWSNAMDKSSFVQKVECCFILGHLDASYKSPRSTQEHQGHLLKSMNFLCVHSPST